jgi:hypothetical protein
MTTSNYFAPGQRTEDRDLELKLPSLRSQHEHGGRNYDETKGVIAHNKVHHSSQYPAEVTISVVKR